MPLANSYAPTSTEAEPAFPLQVHVCEHCWFMQVPPLADPAAVFSDYAYFSSFSSTWRQHCESFAEQICAKHALGEGSRVIEIASNDGYLLGQFQQRGVQVLGIEPAQNIAAYANAKGVPTTARFFHRETALDLQREGISADVIIANNVLAHVPDIHGFAAGFAPLLKSHGTVSFEFPHVLQLLHEAQFDTIYHEHFSYLSLAVVQGLLRQHGLAVVDVQHLPTHGGSLRVFAQKTASAPPPSTRVAACLQQEQTAGLQRLATYHAFAQRSAAIKHELLQALHEAKRNSKRVAAYGAPAKGNTLLNYCGITPELVAYTVDANPEKQGKFLPGSRLPVYAPAHLLADKPDIVLILPWNITREIVESLPQVHGWGGSFLRAIPKLEVL